MYGSEEEMYGSEEEYMSKPEEEMSWQKAIEENDERTSWISFAGMFGRVC